MASVHSACVSHLDMKRILFAVACFLHVFVCNGFLLNSMPIQGFGGPHSKLHVRTATPARIARESAIGLKGSLQRRQDAGNSKRFKSMTTRNTRGAQSLNRKSPGALALIEPRGALTLISAPSMLTPFQARLAAAIVFFLFIAIPSVLPATQSPAYRQRLADMQRFIPGAEWLQNARRDGVDKLAEKHYALLCVVAASTLPLLFGLAIGYTSPCLGPICSDMSLSTVQASSFASVLSIGAVTAAFVGMREVNRLGRKPVIVMTAACYAVGYALITMASVLGYWGLLAGRFFTGVGAGLANVVTPMYIAEMSPPKLRGLFGTFYQLATCAGILIMYMLGAWVDWRVAAAASTVLAATLTIVSQTRLPETPAYLVQRGRDAEAGGVLRRLVSDRTQAQAEEIVGEMKAVGGADEEGEAGKKQRGALGQMVESKGARRSLSIIAALMFFQQFTGINAVIYFSSQILDAAGYGVSASKAAIGLGFAQLVGTAYSASQADARSRRTVLMVSGVGMALGMAMITAYFACQAGLLAALPMALLGPETAVMGLLVYILLFSVGWGPVPWLLVSELFPPHKRPMATGLCTVLAWGGTFIITQGTTMLLSSAGPAFVFASFLATTLLSVGWVLSPVFLETNGKSLREVQDDLER